MKQILGFVVIDLLAESMFGTKDMTPICSTLLKAPRRLPGHPPERGRRGNKVLGTAQREGRKHEQVNARGSPS